MNKIKTITKQNRGIKTIKEKVFYIVTIATSIFFLFFFITCTYIGYETKKLCEDATRQYGKVLSTNRKDCVEALVAQLDDENQSFRNRNHAIWALGQMGDNRALPVLQKYYTGNIPNKEPLDGVISQYELKKAINLAGGAVNISAFIWRAIISDI